MYSEYLETNDKQVALLSLQQLFGTVRIKGREEQIIRECRSGTAKQDKHSCLLKRNASGGVTYQFKRTVTRERNRSGRDEDRSLRRRVPTSDEMEAVDVDVVVE